MVHFAAPKRLFAVLPVFPAKGSEIAVSDIKPSETRRK